MLNDWSTWIIEDIEDRCGEALGSEQERIECWSTQDMVCYVTVGTFAQRGLSSTAKTLRSLSGVRGSEY